MEARNKSARIKVDVRNRDANRRVTFAVRTANRDEGTMVARADVRERDDVFSGRSLRGLSVKTAGGRMIRFSGSEARTLLRVLSQAAEG